MDYSSTIGIASERCPGVVFTIRRMTWARRAELEELQAAASERIRAVQAKMAPLAKEYRAAVEDAKALVQPQRDELVASGKSREEAQKLVPLGTLGFPDEKFRELVEYSDQVRKIDVEELTPIAVNYAFVGFAGLRIDGEDGTLDLVRQRGPDSLYEEIAEAVERELELSTEERENLSSPSTLAAEVGGAKTPGIATPVETLVTISTVGAPSSMVPGSADTINIGTLVGL